MEYMNVCPLDFQAGHPGPGSDRFWYVFGLVVA